MLYSDLATQVLNRADMAYSKNVTDPEMLFHLNAAAAELYELLTINFQADYAVSEMFVSSPAGVDLIPLPDDFFKLLGFDVFAGDGYREVRPYLLNQRREYRQASLIPSQIYRLTYIPLFENAQALSDEVPPLLTMQNYHDLIVLTALIRIQKKLNVEEASLENEKEKLIMRIVRNSANRNASRAPQLGDFIHHYHDLDRWYPISHPVRVNFRLAGANIKLVPTGVFR